MKTPPIFEDVRLSWNGTERVIPADSLLKLIGMVEDIITITDLHRHSQSGSVPFAKVAQAYGAVLRYAGFRVQDEEVYASMFRAGNAAKTASDAVNMLLVMMLPPKALQEEALMEANANPKRKAGRSSKSATKSGA